MVEGLIQLQQRLQEAENLIQKLEDQLQNLIDEENRPGTEERSRTSAEPLVQDTAYGFVPDEDGMEEEATQSIPSRYENSYGARYADVSEYSAYDPIQTGMGHSISGEARDSSFCIGREGGLSSYARPV